MVKPPTTRRKAPSLKKAEPDQCYTVEQVASLIGVHHWTIRNLIYSGKLSAFKVNRLVRIRAEDLRRYMETRKGAPDKRTLHAVRIAQTG